MSDFEVIKLPPGAPLVMDQMKFVMELRPTKMYVLPDGTMTGKPSYAFVLEGPWGEIFVAQISDKMLREGMGRAQLSVLPPLP